MHLLQMLIESAMRNEGNCECEVKRNEVVTTECHGLSQSARSIISLPRFQA
jgi:hypothetical protein